MTMILKNGIRYGILEPQRVLRRLENDLSFNFFFFFSGKKEVTTQNLSPALFSGTLCDDRNVL